MIARIAMAVVFYNTRPARSRPFLLAVDPFPPGRVDEITPAADDDVSRASPCP